MAKDQFAMQDPTKQYPQLDIPEQTQPEPGLDKDLKPLADHGIETYRGCNRLKGRRALITGGDSGIGRAVAIAYAREGADVAIVYLPAEQEDADVVIREIEATGQKAVALAGDISDEDFARSVVAKAAGELGGPIDILVNNAAKQVFVEDPAQLSSEQFEQTFRVNVFAMFWISQAALQDMPAGGVIINTTSIQAYQPSPGLLDYASTKAAIVAFTKGLAKTVAERGIRVNAVAPGPIWTPLQPSYGQSQEKLTQFGQNTPLGRAGQPAELAPTYVFLASQESSYITAEVIGVTGGNHTP
ncbi:SDR family oxidoreductase [Candidatus Saccharibacteria bacterium]|nr:SDR family oxidoreductase [Candidatus Saccharibacteria bacterium]